MEIKKINSISNVYLKACIKDFSFFNKTLANKFIYPMFNRVLFISIFGLFTSYIQLSFKLKRMYFHYDAFFFYVNTKTTIKLRRLINHSFSLLKYNKIIIIFSPSKIIDNRSSISHVTFYPNKILYFIVIINTFNVFNCFTMISNNKSSFNNKHLFVYLIPFMSHDNIN